MECLWLVLAKVFNEEMVQKKTSTMVQVMPEWLETLYVCYLGKHKGIRLCAISKFVNGCKGREFFDKHSTQKDTILDFLKKVDAKGLYI